MEPRKIPLFPLATVLFPGGVLPLRIFEPRYLSMVGECMRNNCPFGVVLICEGQEAGMAAEFHSTGTLAVIEDFNQLEDGHLGLTCRGLQRFGVVSYEVEDDQLVVAKIIEIANEGKIPMTPEYEELSNFVRKLGMNKELDIWFNGLHPDWDNPEWLSYRLCEILPITMYSRQALLQFQSKQRLDRLRQVMKESQLI